MQKRRFASVPSKKKANFPSSSDYILIFLKIKITHFFKKKGLVPLHYGGRRNYLRASSVLISSPSFPYFPQPLTVARSTHCTEVNGEVGYVTRVSSRLVCAPSGSRITALTTRLSTPPN